METKAHPSIREIQFNTRWPIRLTGDQTFIVEVPVGNCPLLHQAAVENLRLSDSEIDRAEDAILRAISIIS